MDNIITEDYQTLSENEQYLYDYCKQLTEALKEAEKWEAFKILVGEEIAFKLLAIIDEGPDTDLRMPA